MRGHVAAYETKAGRRWRILFDAPPGPNGERRQRQRRGFESEGDAERALTKALARVDDGLHVDVAMATVGEYLTVWLEGQQVRPTTRARYRQSIDRHLSPHLGGIRLQALTAEDVDRCYRILEERGSRVRKPLAPKTIRNAHGVIRKALADATRRGHVIRNVAELANPPALVRTEMKTWDGQELAAFLAHVASDRLLAMWTLYATTGMRRGEVLGLRWQDVHLDRKQLAVRHNLTVANGQMIMAEPKTTKGRRSIALDGRTVALLRSHRKAQAAEKLLAGPVYEDRGYVFAWEDGSPIHPQNPTRWFKLHAVAAGLDPIRLHDLRHTWATLALSRGVPAKVVSERLGHANVSITLDVYTHAIPALDQDAADTVAAAIFGEPS